MDVAACERAWCIVVVGDNNFFFFVVEDDDDDVGIAAAVNGTEDDEKKEEEVDEVDEEDAVLLFLGNAFDNLRFTLLLLVDKFLKTVRPRLGDSLESGEIILFHGIDAVLELRRRRFRSWIDDLICDACEAIFIVDWWSRVIPGLAVSNK